MAHDVFVSCSAKDKSIGEAVSVALEAQGLSCWIAPRDILPGRDWGGSIIEAINDARVMVLIFSANANTSVQVKREVERAVTKDKPIIPFRIENVVPTASFEYFLSTPQWLDAFTPPLEPHLQYLAKVVRTIVSGPEASVQPPLLESARREKAEAEAAWVTKERRKVEKQARVAEEKKKASEAAERARPLGKKIWNSFAIVNWKKFFIAFIAAFVLGLLLVIGYFLGESLPPKLPPISSSVAVISKGKEKFIYVADSDQGEVLVMRATDLSKPNAHIPIGTSGNTGERGRPEQMLAVKHNQSNWIFVTDTKSNKVHVIEEDSVVGSFSVGLAPRSLAVTPDGRKLFVSNEQPVPSGTIQVFDISGPDPDHYVSTATIKNITCPEGLAPSPRGNLLYVATQCGGGMDPLLIIDTATAKITGSIPNLAVGSKVAVSADGSRLYVSRGNYPCKMSDGEDGSPLSIVDSRSKKILNTVCLQTSVGSIAISRDPEGQYLFVANGDRMTVFDRKSLDTSATSLNEIPLGGGISGIGVAEDNSVYAFVPGDALRKPLLFLYNPEGLK